MTVYTFGPFPAIDPGQNTVTRNASGMIYAVDDVARATPLTVRDLNDIPMTGVKVGDLGITEEFRVDNYAETIWKSGPFEVHLVSYRGLMDRATQLEASAAASAQAAAASQAAAQAAAGGGAGVSAHGQLSGLAGDDHLQYLTEARGDARYPTPAGVDSQITTAVAASSTDDRNRGLHTGTQAISTVVGLQPALDAKVSLALTEKVITASYTLILADAVNTVLHSTAAGAITVTVPTDVTAAIPQEQAIPWRQYGAGQITFAAASGASIVSRGGALKSAGQYAGGLLTKVGANAWLLEGDITT